MIKPTPFSERESQLLVHADTSVGSFFAMGCPCEVLLETTDPVLAERLLAIVRDEAWRLEALWSRYLPTSLVQQLNQAPDKALSVDAETAKLLDYCEQLWTLSEGGFDITSGVLREVWHFDGSEGVPDEPVVAAVMQRVGWGRVRWNAPEIVMQPGMEIDFGGVGKEYAVDRCCQRLRAETVISALVNFGGDCGVSSRTQRESGWKIGVEAATRPGTAGNVLTLREGAVATSGSTYRYQDHNGQRLGHILDARTGWPVRNAPQSVTVTSDSCLEAGMLATLACLQGADAEDWLNDAGVVATVQR
ncbi:MAG: FAD:protein FMN transferase [Pseudomonadales bacterium]